MRAQVETHVAGCARCAAELRGLRDMRQALAAAPLRYTAPAALRRRIEARLPRPRAAAPDRRSLLKGFALGHRALGGGGGERRGGRAARRAGPAHARRCRLGASALAAGRPSHRRAVDRSAHGEAVVQRQARCRAAGRRSHRARLHADRRPARLHRRKPVAAIVYKRRAHVINLFVAQAAGAAPFAPKLTSVQGFNIRRWSDQGLELLAVSDINADELQEFADKFQAALRAGGA